MKEYKKLFMEISTFEEDVVTLSNGGDGGEVGESGDGGKYGNLFG